EVRRRRVLIRKMQALPIIGNRDPGKTAGIRVLIVQIIIFERAVAPRSEVIIEIRPRADAPALAIIDMHRAIELLIQQPGITAQQEWSEFASIARNKIKNTGSGFQRP